MSTKKLAGTFDHYKFGFKTKTHSVFKSPKGLTKKKEGSAFATAKKKVFRFTAAKRIGPMDRFDIICLWVDVRTRYPCGKRDGAGKV